MSRPLKNIQRPAVWLMVALIRGYQLLLAPFARGCRFAPSCSAYAVEALETHGIRHGGALALRRILRCHPWGSSGFDPVPSKKDSTFQKKTL